MSQRRSDEELLRQAAERESFERDLRPVTEQLVELFISSATSHIETHGADLSYVSDGIPTYLGDFHLLRELGRGGMGIVFEAFDRKLERRVAVKVLPAASMMERRRLTRFKIEARAAAKLRHPNIVPVYSIESDRGFYYFSMQLIQGHNLSKIISSLRHLRGERTESQLGNLQAAATADTEQHLDISSVKAPLSNKGLSETVSLAEIVSTNGVGDDPRYFRVVAEIGLQVAEALQHTHDAEIVHRDIKPGNLLLDTSGHVWLTDFGLAQIQNEPGVTRVGDFVGTLRYMSPEQTHASRIVIDKRSDIYSLGLTLYELITLRPAHDAANERDLNSQIAFRDPPSPGRINGRVPQELDTIVMKALEKNPDRRFQTAQELADDLRRFTENRAIRTRPPSMRRRLAKWGRRHRSSVAAACVAILLLLCGSLGTTWAVLHQNRQIVLARDKTQEALEEKELLLRRERAERAAAQSGALRRRNPGLALLLANEGYRRHASRSTVEALLAALDASHEWRTLPHGELVGSCHALADGSKAVTTTFAAEPGPRTTRVWLIGLESDAQVINDSAITSAVLSPDGERVLASRAGNDGSAMPPVLWSAPDIRRELPGARLKSPDPTQFHPDSQRIVLPREDGTAAVYSVSSGQPVLSLEDHESPVRYAAFGLRGETIVTVSEQGHVRIWESDSGEQRVMIETGPTDNDSLSSRTVSLSPQGDMLLMASQQQGVRWWDLKSRARVNTGFCAGQRAGWVNNGQHIFTHLFARGFIEIRDARSGLIVRRLHSPSRLYEAAASPDGKWIAGANQSQEILVWHAGSGVREAVLRGHEKLIKVVEFAGNDRLISASVDGTARIWNRLSGAARATVPRRAAGQLLAISPDSEEIAVGAGPSYELCVVQAKEGIVQTVPGLTAGPPVAGWAATVHGNTATLWELAPRRAVSELHSFDGDLRSAIASHNGRWLAALSALGSVLVQDTQAGRQWQVDGYEGGVNALRFHPSEPLLLTGGRNGKLVLWDVVQGLPQFSTQLPTPVLQTVFAADGSKFAAHTDQDIHVWQVPPGDSVRLADVQDAPFDAIQFVSGGRRLAAYHRARTAAVRVFDADTGALVAQHPAIEGGARVRQGIGDDELLLASRSGGIVWNVESGQSKMVVDQAVQLLVAGPDGSSYVAATHSGKVTLNAMELLRVPPSALRASRLVFVDASSGATRELALDGRRAVGIYPWREGQLLVTTERYGWAACSASQLRPMPAVWGHASPLTTLRYSPNSQKLVSASWDGSVCLWHAESGELLRRIDAQSPVLVAVMAPDGRHVATGTLDGKVRLWDQRTGQLNTQFDGHNGPVWHIEFDSPAARLLSVSGDGTARLWNLRSPDSRVWDRRPIGAAQFAPQGRGLLVMETERVMGRPDVPGPYHVYVYPSPDGEPATIALEKPPIAARFDSSGKRIVTVRSDGKVAVWDAGNGSLIATLPTIGARDAVFSPDGERLLTSTFQNVTLWRWDDQTITLSYSPDEGVLTKKLWPPSHRSEPFAPNGTFLVVASLQASARRLPLELGQLVRQNMPRRLTSAERAQFQLDDVER